MDNKRGKIQAIFTVLTNANIKGFFTGKIYKGPLKKICVPGMNCYSCPGALGSCPIGSLQSVIGSSKGNFPYYIIGILMLFGIVLGRLICGFLCPFGWFQELIHKIPSKKYETKKFNFLKYLKYIILIIFVIILPHTISNELGMGDPWFCKWLCPVGILEGAIPLSIVDTGIRAALGSLFTWKLFILIGFVLLSLFFYRPFCKWICPLGAIYSLFNRISFYQYSVDSKKCIDCNACANICKMDVDVSKTPNHPECIRCGDCLDICPTNAINTSISKANEKIKKELI